MAGQDPKAVLSEELPKLATKVSALAEPAPVLRLLIEEAVNEVQRLEAPEVSHPPQLPPAGIDAESEG